MPKSPAKVNAVEIDRFCKYIHRYCHQTRLSGYDYCIRHILEDKTAPFRQCTFVHQPTKKRCTNAAPKTEKSERRDNTLCPFHSKKAVEKIKTSTKKKEVEGPAGFLRCFEHYCTQPNHDSSYDASTALSQQYDMAPCADTCFPSNNFNSAEGEKKDTPFLANVTQAETLFDDPNEYISARNDPLRHAGVYTAKEIVSITRQKALHLQKLYLRELSVLFEQQKENRKKYLTSVKNEASTSDIRKMFNDVESKKLKALVNFHKPRGLRKVFRRKVDEKRCELMGQVKGKKQRCIFPRNDAKCGKIALPLTKFCRDHISADPHQVLFRPCLYSKSLETPCKKFTIPIENDTACDSHMHFTLLSSKASEIIRELSPTDSTQEQEHFQSMDDIASLGLDVVTPGSLFGLDQFGEPGESTDTVLSEDQADLMQIQGIALNPATDILCDSRKSESEEEK